MSVIENPLAYMDETQNVEYDEQTPMGPMNNEVKKKMTKPQTANFLDETPLTTEKNKSKSPRQLHETTSEATKEGLPDLSLSSQLGDVEKVETTVSADSKTVYKEDVKITAPRGKGEEATSHVENKETPTAAVKKAKKSTASGVNFLEIANQLDSDSEDDVEYVPGTEPEDLKAEEENEDEQTVARQYSLRDGLRGTVADTKEIEHDDTDKKKADDLWSAFKADVAIPIKRKAKELETTIKEKTYDFAGETVTVREEIRNKRKSIVSSLGLDRKRRRESAPVACRSSSVETDGSSVEREPEAEASVKRSRPVSKLNSLVNRLTKKPKLSVMNKTALDWENYKKQKEIEDDVKNEAKAEGYLEKQDFLSRTDERQYELEKEIRMQQQRRRQMMNSRQF